MTCYEGDLLTSYQSALGVLVFECVAVYELNDASAVRFVTFDGGLRET